MKRFEIYNAIKRSDESSVRVSMLESEKERERERKREERGYAELAVYYWSRC